MMYRIKLALRWNLQNTSRRLGLASRSDIRGEYKLEVKVSVCVAGTEKFMYQPGG
jgi:hypothetical protein